jgi:hypothetical protein
MINAISGEEMNKWAEEPCLVKHQIPSKIGLFPRYEEPTTNTIMHKLVSVLLR